MERGDALSVLKEILRGPGRPMLRDEAIAFINQPMFLVRPTAQPGKRGPKKRRTVYDEAFDRRRGIYHRLVRLPEARRATGRQFRERVRKVAEEVLALGITRRKFISTVTERLQLAGFTHDRTSVSRVLKTLHYLK